jgi:hypothetical protein
VLPLSKHIRRGFETDIQITISKKPQEKVQPKLKSQMVHRLRNEGKSSNGLSAAPASGVVSNENQVQLRAQKNEMMKDYLKTKQQLDLVRI